MTQLTTARHIGSSQHSPRECAARPGADRRSHRAAHPIIVQRIRARRGDFQSHASAGSAVELASRGVRRRAGGRAAGRATGPQTDSQCAGRARKCCQRAATRGRSPESGQSVMYPRRCGFGWEHAVEAVRFFWRAGRDHAPAVPGTLPAHVRTSALDILCCPSRARSGRSGQAGRSTHQRLRLASLRVHLTTGGDWWITPEGAPEASPLARCSAAGRNGRRETP
jgi:hypothetical protein